MSSVGTFRDLLVMGGGLVRGDFQGTVLVAERRGDLGDAVQ